MANMTARMKRLTFDWEQISKDFANHQYIKISPVGIEPYERYNVTYFVNGIYLKPDGQVEVQSRHEVEITLHSEYPRYKPLCKIMTPIWHPNFRDGQICIGDIWGAGENLSDIIINIGNMIQYKSWNSYSPLSADAAKWAIEHKQMFPVGNIELNIANAGLEDKEVEIALEGEEEEKKPETVEDFLKENETESVSAEDLQVNDFDIFPEELINIEFVPTTQRNQTLSSAMVKSRRVNFKTIFIKGLLWAILGAILAFAFSELTDGSLGSTATAARLMGHSEYAIYCEYKDEADEAFEEIMERFEAYCEANSMDPDAGDSFSKWLSSGLSESDRNKVTFWSELYNNADDAFYTFYMSENGNEDVISDIVANVTRVETAIWSASLAVFIGLLLGIGEGVYYGSASKGVIYAAIGAGVSLVIGFLSGYTAQAMYSSLLSDTSSEFVSALVRGLGWLLMGLGIGVAIGLIKPGVKRILLCGAGGATGGFTGGFLFNYVCEIIPNDVVARGVAIIIMGALIGLGVGLLEQFAKQAWLKVVRGAFEGKEYIVFTGTTTIGNTGKNMIVLFKDKLIAPHHCDIVQEGGHYVIVDSGSPMGTVVNGMRVTKHTLRHGDTIAIGNSVLIFNTK